MSFYTDLIRRADAIHATGRVPLFLGPPGVGKSSLMDQLASRDDAKGYVDVLFAGQERTDATGNMRSGTWEFGGKTRNTTEYLDPAWAVRACTLGETGTFYVKLDELPKADPGTQVVVQTILSERIMPSGTPIPDGVRFIAAGNPSPHGSGTELIPSLANRLVHLDFTPPVADFVDAFLRNFDRGPLSQEEMRIRAAAGQMFLSEPDLLYVDPHAVDTTGAWPSPRSWEAAVQTMAVTDPRDWNVLASGCVGQGYADRLIAAVEGFTLLTAPEIAANPESLLRRDVTTMQAHGSCMAMFGLLLSDPAGSPTVPIDRALMSIDVLAGGGNLDLAAALLPQAWASSIRHGGSWVPSSHELLDIYEMMS